MDSRGAGRDPGAGEIPKRRAEHALLRRRSKLSWWRIVGDPLQMVRSTDGAQCGAHTELLERFDDRGAGDCSGRRIARSLSPVIAGRCGLHACVCPRKLVGGHLVLIDVATWDQRADLRN